MNKYIPLAQARKQFSQIIKEVRDEGAVYAITIHERTAALLIRTRTERNFAVSITEGKLRKIY